MRIHPAEQGTDEWRQARAGIPTASCFDDILTPAQLKPAKSEKVDKYLYRLLAEWRLGRPLDDSAGSVWTDRGTSMEDEARNWYAWEKQCDPRRVGLCLTDDGKVGASPDALVGEDGGLEIKCPGAGVVARYVDRPDDLYADHRLQVQGGLLVTGRKWWDLCAYCPGFPEVLLRVEPEEDVQAALRAALDGFCARLEEAKARWLARGLGPLPPVARMPMPSEPMREGERAGQAIDFQSGAAWA